MIANVPIIVLGLLLGMRHAADADHVIAVATIMSRQRSAWGAALIGSLWGIGHTVTITLVGGVIILFEVVIPARVGLAMEFGVALMLILLGTLNLTGLMRQVTDMFTAAHGVDAGIHAHPHSHSDYVHTHPHKHEPESHGHTEDEIPLSRLDRMFGSLGGYQALRPLIVGIVHGLAGSAAVTLLILATIRDPLWAIAYLLVFGAGSIGGMMLVTAAIGLPFAYTAGRSVKIHRYLGIASGLLSVGFGLVLAYQIGVVDGLFTSHPRWTP
ncbi:MAG TPA: high-affinity nickel-transport family protein [Methylomirabilota bacterium]|nr:high-affinity nickel-transport family protein [Methylomirabilota bacterium]